MVTLAQILAESKAALSEADIDDPTLEARMIVEHFSGTTRTDSIARPDTSVSGSVAATIRAAVDRRLKGEPVHRIFGFRDFHGIRLVLSADTLEPRPDTETLVDAVLPFMRERMAASGTCRILDLGTGTGDIAIALLDAVKGAIGVATDIAEGALLTAAANARAAGIADRLRFVRSDWFDAVEGRYDAIVSNPPYIPSDEIAGLDREVRDFDPRRALDGGPDGLGPYRAMASQASRFLLESSIVAVEIGYGQGVDIRGIFAEAGYVLDATHRDLAGIERVLVFRSRTGS